MTYLFVADGSTGVADTVLPAVYVWKVSEDFQLFVELLELAPMKGETGAGGIVFLNCCLSLINVNWLGKNI